MPTQKGSDNPPLFDTAHAIGTRTEIVPTLVPIAIARFRSDPAESAGHNEDEQHGDDVVISYSLGADVYFLIKRELTVLKKCRDQGNGEREYD